MVKKKSEVRSPSEGETSNRFECSVCASEFGSAQRFECPSCKFTTCKGCQKTYLRPECMNCRITFTRAFLLTQMGKTWVQGPLKKHSQDILMRREKSILPAAIPEASRVKAERALRERSRFAENSIIIRGGEEVQNTATSGAAPDEEDEEPGTSTRVPDMLTAQMIKTNRRKLLTAIVPCPVSGCRGFLERGVCRVCMTKTCLGCLRPIVQHEQSQGEKKERGGGEPGAAFSATPTTPDLAPSSSHTNYHVCRNEDVASVDFMLKDSRPCPNCGVFIHRTFGCSHMHCTHCRAHWDWNTGRILRSSTNGHYNHLQTFARDVATIARNRQAEGQGLNRDLQHDLLASRNPCDETGMDEDPQDATEDAIPRDRVEATTDKALMTALYDDPNVVRYSYSRMYDPNRLSAAHDAGLLKLRILFLLNDIDENVWSRRLFTCEHAFERDSHISEVLRLYLFAVRDLQRALAQRVIDGLERMSLLDSQRALVRMCNQSLASLRDEYGGPRIMIRENVYDRDVAPLYIE